MRFGKKILCIGVMLNMMVFAYSQKTTGPDRRFVGRKDPSLRAHSFDGQHCAAFRRTIARRCKRLSRRPNSMTRFISRQIWSGNEALLAKLQADKSVLGQQRLHYFMINKGPWSQLDDHERFIEGVPPRPPVANFYPEDMTKDEFNTWLNSLSADEKEKATGYFYTIRRDPNGKLKTVPYSEEYREFLEPAAKLLREAAALTTNATLKNFLNKRAAAFLSNDYYDSDVAWMDLDSPIDLTIEHT